VLEERGQEATPGVIVEPEPVATYNLNYIFEEADRVRRSERQNLRRETRRLARSGRL
jgi:hypothetical protein